MDRFQEMQAFVRTAERSSFSQAADDLNIPRATITNIIKRLEMRLGTRLLERTTRQVRLTHDGEAYYQRCVRLLADVEEADGAFRGAMPKGLLTVNLQGTLARHFVMPALPEFLTRYPGLRLHISEDDRLVDLVREGVDCVLRAGTLRDSSMIGRQVASMEQVSVASPAYLMQFGEPGSIADLEHHFAVDYISSTSGRAVPLSFNLDRRVIDIPMRSTISVTGADLYTSSAIAGAGLIQVPRYRIATELADGQLKIVLPAFPPPPMPVSVLYLQNRHLSPRVRIFAQWLAEIFKVVPFRVDAA
jgi:DNA-binding transcriptional LysR family regulator